MHINALFSDFGTSSEIDLTGKEPLDFHVVFQKHALYMLQI